LGDQGLGIFCWHRQGAERAGVPWASRCRGLRGAVGFEVTPPLTIIQHTRNKKRGKIALSFTSPEKDFF
jgi:hypothetical protein